MTQEYDVIVIGGGIIGCSTAYHLAKNHKKSVLLLEQGRLTSGTTWHAAGLVGQLRSSAAITQLLRYSVEFYESITQETGLDTGWRMTGCLRLARNHERMIEFNRSATTAKSFGLDMDILTPKQAQKLFPLLDINGLVGASFLASDGQASPSDITMAIAKGAKMHGVTIMENCEVLDILSEKRRITGVKTTKGEVRCEKIVNCAGIWSRQLGEKSGVHIPIVAIKHQYVITEKINGINPNTPTIRDPDLRTYFKEEVGGLVFGGYEPNPQVYETGIIPKHEFHLFDDDFNHFEPMLNAAMQAIPDLAKVGVKKMMHGAESFTPDGNFILGKAPNWQNYFVGTGFNAFGIASGGGAGQALAYWVAHDESPSDLWSVDIRRFHEIQSSTQYLVPRTCEAYAKHYTIAYPNDEYLSARDILTSPIYHELKSKGAVFGSKLGWERVNYVNTTQKPHDFYEIPSMNRAPWFELVGNEHHAVRNQVGIFDQSSFAKFIIKGQNALQALNFLSAMPISNQNMRINYRQLLNQRGGIECDLAITQISEDEFYIITGTGFRVHDFAWIAENTKKFQLQLTDITHNYGVLSLMGPQSRNILNKLANAPLSANYGRAEYINIQNISLLALRISYVGELGYELHIPIEYMADIFHALMAHDIAICGYRAIESLRLEKAYRAWGGDIASTDDPIAAGLPINLGTNRDYIGKDAIEKIASQPKTRQLVSLSASGDAVLSGRETILRNGEIVGYCRSAGYGYTLNQSIGMGYIRNQSGINDDYLLSGNYQLVVANQIIPAQIHLTALYDKENLRKN